MPTPDVDGATKLYFGSWGGLTMVVLAYGVFLQPNTTYQVGVLNAEGYRTYGLVASGIILVGIRDTHEPNLARLGQAVDA